MNLEIFFDESGKRDNPPMLMGAVSVPQNIYLLDDIQKINNELQQGKKSYHFTRYNGDYGMKDRICTLLSTLSPYLRLMRVNVIKYNKIENKKNVVNANKCEDMIYSKFPERVFYGLLRHKGSLMKIKANIFMEDAEEYKDFTDRLKDQLNIQSLYRGESFTIDNCTRVPKYTEIGVEFIDIILGIIRVILNFKKGDNNVSKTYNEKVKLVNVLLIDPNVYKFLSTIKYYEWDHRESLREIDFRDYLDKYISENY